MSGMAKCPLSHECGQELVILSEGESIEFKYTDISKGTVCIFPIFTDINLELQKFTFEVSKQDNFLGGVYSNPAKGPFNSGEVEFDFQLKEGDEKSINFQGRGYGQHLVLMFKALENSNSISF